MNQSKDAATLENVLPASILLLSEEKINTKIIRLEEKINVAVTNIENEINVAINDTECLMNAAVVRIEQNLNDVIIPLISSNDVVLSSVSSDHILFHNSANTTADTTVNTTANTTVNTTVNTTAVNTTADTTVNTTADTATDATVNTTAATTATTTTDTTVNTTANTATNHDLSNPSQNLVQDSQPLLTAEKIYIGSDIHAYTSQINKVAERYREILSGKIDSDKFETLLTEMLAAYGPKDTFVNLKNVFHEGFITDPEVPTITVAILLEKVWSQVKESERNEAKENAQQQPITSSLKAHFDQTLNDISMTCIQGISHRLFIDFVAFCTD